MGDGLRSGGQNRPTGDPHVATELSVRRGARDTSSGARERRERSRWSQVCAPFARAVLLWRRWRGLATRRPLRQSDLASMDDSLHTYAALSAAGLAILRPNAETFCYRLLRWYV